MIATLLLALAIAAPAPTSDKTELWLNIANAGVRINDAASTRHMLTTGAGHEVILPGAIVNHDWSMWTFTGGVVVTEFLISHYLIHHGHAREGKSLLISDIALDGYAGTHNWTLKKPDQLTPIIINVPVTLPR